MNKQTGQVVVTVFDTPVRIKPGFWGVLATLWAVMMWLTGRRLPGRTGPARLLIGSLATPVLMSADVVHALAHIFSARLAGGPMDEIVLGMHMPQTLYHDNQVPPAVHRGRALGGPVYSGAAMIADLAARQMTPKDSAIHEILGWSAAGNGFILAGSLLPLPFVDGGSILKWTLVERGQSEAAADQTVQVVNVALGATAAVAGAGLLARRRRWPGLGLIAAGAFLVAAGLGKIRQI